MNEENSTSFGETLAGVQKTSLPESLPKSAKARDGSRTWRISSERFARLAKRSGKSGEGVRMPMAVGFRAFAPEPFASLSE